MRIIEVAKTKTMPLVFFLNSASAPERLRQGRSRVLSIAHQLSLSFL
jgi:hypothetical protein